MDDHRLEGPGENGNPVPRDLPDQQAGAGDDPWEAPSAPEKTPAARDEDTPDDSDDTAEPPDADDTPDPDTPDTDEAGTGRRGAPHAATVHPEHPTPDESPA
ncbi:MULTISPECIES: hypothetical protein [unclassified Streptomyces]|uniref:hypothetical protein n=1 Tax=unclassified Streptomyces TaxID=2593676 RepID=UPI00381B680C